MVGKPDILSVIPDNIPAELRAEADWVCWRMEWRDGKDGKEGKWTKVPYNARTNQKAKSNDSSTWSKFELAMNAYSTTANRYDGVGFMLADQRPKSGGLIGVDFDHVVDPSSKSFLDWTDSHRGLLWLTTTPSPEQLIGGFDSYSEFSPSGTGVRVFIKGRLWDEGRKQGALEIYDCGRFLTVTGHLVPGRPATINAPSRDFLKAFHAYFFAKEAKPAKQTKRNGTSSPVPTGLSSGDGPSVETIIRLAKRFNPKFETLFGGGLDIYGSQSEADAALCCLLAFYAGPTGHSLIDGVFRQSGLYRDKWDESHSSNGTTYGEMTIEGAIAQCGDFFDWNKPGQIIPDSDDPTPNEAIDDPHRLARINIERYTALTNGGTIRYWREEWYAYKRDQYRRIGPKDFAAKLGASIKAEFDRANIVAQKMWEERQKAAASENKELKEDRPEARKVTTTLIKNVIQATASMQILSSDVEMNSVIDVSGRSSNSRKRRWISMQNGIVDLDALLADEDDDKTLLPHTKDWFSTICLPYAFDPTARCPKWEAFLRRNLENDRERINVLQEWFGYCLIPSTDFQKFLFMEGEGSNGKSVALAVMEAMIGRGNCSHVQLEQFESQFIITQITGKLINFSNECSEIETGAEGMLKSIASGDPMTFNRKNLDPIEYSPFSRLVLSGNSRPRFSDKSFGLWRRMICMPWLVTISDNEKVVGMDKRQWWEESGELPGILNWAVEGLARLLEQNRFSESSVVTAATNSYRLDMNPTKLFLHTNYIEGHPDSCWVTTTTIFEHYKNWALENGYRPVSEGTFGKELTKHFKRTKKKRFRFADGTRQYAYTGIKPGSAPDDAEELEVTHEQQELFDAN